MYEGSDFSIVLPMLIVIYLFKYNILVDVKWFLIVVLICMVLTANDEQLFMCLLANFILSLEECLFRFFAYELIRLFVLFIVGALYIF